MEKEKEMTLDVKKVIDQVKEINRLQSVNDEPFKKEKQKFLRENIIKELLENGFGILEIDDIVLNIDYSNPKQNDYSKPYLQIYKKKNWIKAKK
jgi:SOS response regulatory protein OraA/RecX